MLNKIILLVFGIAVIFCTYSCIKTEPQKKELLIMSMLADERLSASDLKSAKIRAMEGDAEAAFKVFLHYAIAEFDSVSSLGWLNIAANHGHAIAQHNMGSLYLDNVLKNVELAKYWLKEADKNGSAEAKKLLKQLEKLETNQKVNSHE